MSVRVLIGDVREKLKELPDKSVHCCVNSPPYFGLRSYLPDSHPDKHLEIGTEKTPAAFIETLVQVYREVRRVLRDDGTLWVNIGDSYNAAGRIGHGTRVGHKQGTNRASAAGLDRGRPSVSALKEKDLIGIPWMLAFALQADGWYLRQDIVWCLSGGAWLYARTPTSIGPMMLKDLVRLRPETVELWNGERWTRVTAWTKRMGRADAKELVLRSGERIGCTDNHVWPTQRGNIRTDALVRGDVIQTARLPTGGDVAGWLTPEAFWFAGLYLAEGSRSGETIQIAGHIKEASRLARLRELVRHYGGSVRDYNHKGNAQNICIDSPALSAVIKCLVAGRTAKDKHLSPRAWAYRDWALKELAQGYLDGDGHYEKKNDRFRLGFCRNYALERDLRCLAARLGAALTLTPGVSKNQTGRSFPSFRGEWRWHQSGHVNARQRSEVLEVRRSRARQFWDVTVADHPHLFALASGVLTHNSKPNPMPESVTDRCTKAHEYVFLLSKKPRYYFDAEAIAEEAIYTGLANQDDSGFKAPQSFNGKHKDGYRSKGTRRAKDNVDCARNPNSRAHSLSKFEAESHRQYATRNKRSVWEIATAPYAEAHYATFPPALVEPCILAGCPKGGTVLDCFGGAGTTGLVADRLGRDAILIDLDARNAELATTRIKGDAPLFAEVGP